MTIWKRFKPRPDDTAANIKSTSRRLGERIMEI
jgi:hypothetical protein